MNRTLTLQIDHAALLHNLARVRHFAPSQKILAVIKANAYGHGALTIAKALSKQVDAFGVAVLGEAVYLRENGITDPIVLMEGPTCQAELTTILEHALQIFVHSWHQLEFLKNLSTDKTVQVWLKIDTGMHRLGISRDKAHQALDTLTKLSCVNNNIILTTHFAVADELEHPSTQHQIDDLTTINNTLSQPLAMSLANSAGIIAWPSAHATWVRPGIMLYGASPFYQKSADELGLKPVMNATTKLIAIKHLHKNDAIGYGYDWTCPEAMPVGIAAVGYGDGYPRYVKNGTPILVNGQVTQVIGRVSMDMLHVDLRPIADAQIGDEVTIWGPGLSPDTVAAYNDITAYELLCHIKH